MEQQCSLIKELLRSGFLLLGNNYNNNLNGNNNLNNNGRVLGITQTMLGHFKVKTYKNLYPQVYDFYNLFLAFKKAKKGKSSKDYVISFEKDLGHNLNILSEELLSLTYRPKSLQTFILR